MKTILLKNNKGFAMLFTVLIITLILSIAIGISNLSLKQMILSSLAKDSQISFYEADTAVECGLYHDSVLGSFPPGTDASTALSKIMCGNNTYFLDNASTMDYLIYKQEVIDASKPCSALYFDKASSVGTNVVQGRGYNICASSPRQVERALEVRY